MLNRMLIAITALCASVIVCGAEPMGGIPGVYINGIVPSLGMSTSDYANGSGAANTNKIDHAIYADTAGAIGGDTLNIGTANIVTGLHSFAIGDNNIASGQSSTTIGSFNRATNSYATAIGQSAIAGGYSSFAIGEGVTATGTDAMALGNNAEAIYDNSFVWSDGTLTTSPTSQTFTIYASNGTYIRGGALYMGTAEVTNNAVSGQQVVNYQTLTNAIATLSPPTVGAAYLASNNIFTAGTTQNMAAAKVSSNAVSGTDVVNYQTMTNTLLAYDTLYSTNVTFAMVDISTTNFGLTGMMWNTPDIMRGRLYIANTNVIPFSKTATLTFREEPVAHAGSAIWQSSMLLSAVSLSGIITNGSTNMYVPDGTDFSDNCLVFVGGSTNEFIRVKTVVGTNLIFKFASTNYHAASNVVSRVREFGGFSTHDELESKTLWGAIEFSAATTNTLNMSIEYSK